jgi:hypothetical protein
VPPVEGVAPPVPGTGPLVPGPAHETGTVATNTGSNSAAHDRLRLARRIDPAA